MDKSEIHDRPAIVAGGEMAEVSEAVESALGTIAVAVDCHVTRDGDLAATI
jgi:hypothetical protein